MPGKWNLTGTYFEACNCNSVCPCVFLSDPTTGDCIILLAWHVEKGKYGDVNLGGLSTVLAGHSPGNMSTTKWDVALYVDEKGNTAQREALGKIFGGHVGGEPAGLALLIGRVLGVRPVPIFYQAHGKERIMRIPSIAVMEVTAMEGQGGKLVTVENQPMTVVPHQTVVVGRSRKLSFHDHGMNMEVTEKNGLYSPFSYKGP